MQSLRLISLAKFGLQVIRQLLLLDYSLETQQSVIAQVGLPVSYCGQTIMCAKFNSHQGTTAETRLPTLCEQMKAAIGFPSFKLSCLRMLLSCLSRYKSRVCSTVYMGRMVAVQDFFVAVEPWIYRYSSCLGFFPGLIFLFSTDSCSIPESVSARPSSLQLLGWNLRAPRPSWSSDATHRLNIHSAGWCVASDSDSDSELLKRTPPHFHLLMICSLNLYAKQLPSGTYLCTESWEHSWLTFGCHYRMVSEQSGSEN